VSIAVALAMVSVAMGLLLPDYFADPQPTLERSLQETPLFDGENFEPWTASRGLWQIGQDEDGGRVLVGGSNGAASTVIPLLDGDGTASQAFAFRVGIDLLEAEAAEIHFGFAADDLESSSRWVVRYQPDALVLGRRERIDADLRVEDRREMPPRAREDDGPGYHHLFVELQGDHWFVFLDDAKEPFGVAPAQPRGNNRVVHLEAIGGDIHFADIAVIKLREKPEPEQP
jgi:hypothetical protein